MNSVEIKDKKNTLYTRCKEIVELCKAEVRDMTEEEQREFDNNKEEIVNLNTELRDLQARLGELDQQMPEQTDNNISTNTKRHMKKNFSLLKALNAQINNRAFDDETLAVLEAGKREFNDSNITTSAAITLPSMESRTIAVTATTAEHDDVIDIDMQSIIMPNYANLVCAKAGAKILTGCKGDVKYPILNGGSVNWENELDEADDAGQTFGSKTLTPHRISATISISKMLLAQDSIGVEAALRADIQKAFEEKVEESIFSTFSGDTKQPAGILADLSATTVSGWSDVCDFEASLEENNVGGNLVYIASPKAKAALRSMDKGGKHTQLVFENGAVDGTPLYTTSNMSGKNALYGNFSNLVIAQWGGYEVITDIYSRAKYGEVVLVINGYIDFALLKDNDVALAELA